MAAMAAVRTLDDQIRITQSLLDDEDRHTEVVEGQMARLHCALHSPSGGRVAYGYESPAAKRGGLVGNGSPPVSATPKYVRYDASGAARRQRLCSPVNTTLIDKMADDLTTSSWSSEGSDAEVTGDGAPPPSPPTAVTRAPFAPLAIIDAALGPSLPNPRAAQPPADVALGHISRLVAWDEVDGRRSILLEEAEARTILGAYSARVAVSATIAEHQLLTLVDHMHYHREALLMQHHGALDALGREMGLTMPTAATRRSAAAMLGDKPSHVNRLL